MNGLAYSVTHLWYHSPCRSPFSGLSNKAAPQFVALHSKSEFSGSSLLSLSSSASRFVSGRPSWVEHPHRIRRGYPTNFAAIHKTTFFGRSEFTETLSS
jgi:hypothetical protein